MYAIRSYYEVDRLAQRPRLLGTVENGDLLDRLGQRLEEGVQRERAIEANLDHANLFPS